MHGHHQDITKVGCTLTVPSQVSEVGPREGEQQAALHLSKTISLLKSKADPALAPLTIAAHARASIAGLAPDWQLSSSIRSLLTIRGLITVHSVPERCGEWKPH